MNAPLIIIGSGFAAYQLVKTLRRKNSDLPIQLFTADSGDEYNKPDLSHVFTRQQTADDLISAKGQAFAMQHQIELFANTRVDEIDPNTHTITANGSRYHFSKLVLATGGSSFIPKLHGDAVNQVMTLNSLAEYRTSQHRIARAQRIVIMGGGLIGTELAMDLCASGKQVQIVEPSAHLMENLMPAFVATALEKQLRHDGVNIACLDYVVSVEHGASGLIAVTSQGSRYQADCIISAAGIIPNTALAQQAGVAVNRGIVVDKQMKTSVDDIYALGDCAEINGQVMAFLQPIVLSANVLASQLLTNTGELTLPPMITKVKTPRYPIQLGGNSHTAASWQISMTEQGIVAKGYDQNQRFCGFVVTQDNVSQTFPLLRELQASN
ncbi:Nitric oxide reductase FlRd-NAD(+) reductase [Vibrio ruber DSM 16370]|uniref:Nitric oxide reductase FlRd-NAD(+) reductase n=1 Tax=Vibrio ruber (strain DSM 16370 / JCM 11486 / BCRC 17186 / CECT 7878 / LMG 23124 / VR1) TaxID=1123498 RepID=A0A1R4LR36_VIBR1|nr:NADH:flavorubredoxin reductase NorW [Vibrio ruber]SJN59062.1 Nitric oxide reductase FlRd-NAD(+) reductase [Vibrio ruber DSM 16370]